VVAMRTCSRFLLGAVLVVLLGATAAPARAQSVQLDVARTATLVEAGQGALLRVSASCPAGAEILEAFVYVNQGGFSTEFGSVNVPCDGTTHTLEVRVTALDFVLHKGKASASGLLLLTTGESISPVQRLHLK
jgi:hypothetical protein